MQMTRVRLFKHGKVVAIGQTHTCRNADAAFDLLIECGYIIQLSAFDPERYPIDDDMRSAFLDACTEANARAIAKYPLHTA